MCARTVAIVGRRQVCARQVDGFPSGEVGTEARRDDAKQHTVADGHGYQMVVVPAVVRWPCHGEERGWIVVAVESRPPSFFSAAPSPHPHATVWALDVAQISSRHSASCSKVNWTTAGDVASGGGSVFTHRRYRANHQGRTDSLDPKT